MWLRKGTSLITKFFVFVFFAILIVGCAPSPCKKLHKVTSQDDLFGQIYDTALNDNCLFKMTPEELQNILEIPVIESSGIEIRNINIKASKYYSNGSLQSSIGLFIEKREGRHGSEIYFEYHIQPTSDYEKRYKTMFPNGILPQSLPSVAKIKKERTEGHNPNFEPDPVIVKRSPYDFLQPGYIYYWKGQYGGKSRMTFQVFGGAISRVIFYDWSPAWEHDLK